MQYTLTEIRNGTGWSQDARFEEVVDLTDLSTDTLLEKQATMIVRIETINKLIRRRRALANEIEAGATIR